MKATESQKDNYEELKWQFALENSNIGIWDFDATLNRVFYSTESKKIIGYDNDEFGVNPNDWNDRVHPDDREKYFQDFQDHLNGIKPLYKNEHRVKCKNGSYKWVSDIGKIIEWNSNGSPKRIIGTHTDITKRKEKETKLASNLSIITSQNKKLLNFAHIVSHNLRTYVGNFESVVEFYEEAESNREKHELFNHLKTISSSLAKTINDLNEIVTLQADQGIGSESLNLLKSVDNIAKLLELQVEKIAANISIDINPSIFIEFNPAYLESIIQNLITNAIKYRKENVPLKILISSQETSNSITLSVKDNGIGIDLKKYGAKLFGMYNTFHNKTEYDSRGIGLYLIRNQLEAFEGTIEVESELNIGTTFTAKFKK